MNCYFSFQFGLLLRVIFFAMIFICNGMMWTLFTKSLQFCSSTAEATVTNTASNFLVSVSHHSQPEMWLSNLVNWIRYLPGISLTSLVMRMPIVANHVQNIRSSPSFGGIGGSYAESVNVVWDDAVCHDWPFSITYGSILPNFNS